MAFRKRHSFQQACAAIVLTSLYAPASGEAVFDGTLGPAGTLSGNFEIPDSFGTQTGGNLFHSFSVFNVNPGESATFTSGFTGVTDNVIARVTGGSLSTIDGLLSSTIPGADLWLINPSGVMFGDNASLSVPGSFHVSSADYLLFEDGGRFDASNPSGTVLTMANPLAFGFLGPNPAPVSVGAATMEVAVGEALSMVGGDVSLTGSVLNAPGGHISIAGLSGPGEVQLMDPDANRANLTSFGDITLNASTVSVNGDGGGDIYILGGQFFGSASEVTSNTLGGVDGGDIRMDVDNLTISDSAGIRTLTFGDGDASSISIDATGTVSVVPGETGIGAQIQSLAEVNTAGNAGSISISANEFDMQFSLVGIFTLGSGQGGILSMDIQNNLNVTGNFGSTLANNSIANANAGDVVINAGDVNFIGGSILVRAFGDGDAGKISLTANNLSMANGAQFGAGAFGIGSGGQIDVEVADTVTMTDDVGFPTAIISGSANGPGGDVTVHSRVLNILEGAEISVGSFGSGAAGSVDVRVDDEILIAGSPDVFTGIFSNSFSVGDAGNVNITTPRLELTDGGSLQASALSDSSGDGGSINLDLGELIIDSGNSFISTRTFSSGNAGDIVVDADRISMAGSASTFDGIFAGAGQFETEGSGNGGSILINTGSLEIIDGAFIQASTFSDGDAGSVSINSTGAIVLDAQDDPMTGIFNNTTAAGNAGPISIVAVDLSVTGLASIQAATSGAGNGGAINIGADGVSVTDGGSIAALTLGDGNAGTIDVAASGELHVSRGDLSPQNIGNIASSTEGSGLGGTITVTADTVLIDDSGVISVGATAVGAGGDLIIEGRIIDIADNGTVSASATSSGNAGTVLLIAVDELLLDNATIETSSEQSAGGNVEINAGTTLFLNDGATISAAANGVTPDDDGGNIAIDPVFVVLRESQILATANAGNGGNIAIQAGSFIIDATSMIDASSQTGLDGQVTIDSVNQVFGSVVLLEAPDIDVSDLITQPCVAAAFRDRSSLTVARRTAPIWSPADDAPSPYDSTETGSAVAARSNPSSSACYVRLTVEGDADAT